MRGVYGHNYVSPYISDGAVGDESESKYHFDGTNGISGIFLSGGAGGGGIVPP